MSKIAVIGEKDSVLPFRLFDFDIYMVKKEVDLPKLLQEIVERKVEIILLTETIAEHHLQTLDQYEEELTPGIILIPSIQGSIGIGKAKIQGNVERAVGQNIL
jgi:V/A-type H+-transporting ATPase subunit F